MTARDNRVTAHATREVRGMLRALQELGFDLDALLGEAGLRREDVEAPDSFVSPRACANVFAGALRERRIANLALRLAERTPIGSSPLLDYLIVTSDSVGQGLERLARYLRLVNPALRIVVKEERDPVRVAIERASGPFEIELTVSLSLLRLRQETEGRLKAAYASFTHQPDDAGEYARRLGCPIRTRAAWSGWALPAEAMRFPLRRRDPSLRRWLEKRAAEALALQPLEGDVRDEVRSVLSAQLTSGDVRIASVARRLSTTPRTLQRRLALAGASFAVLCDDARKRAAEAYLADPRLSIAEIAWLLGYSQTTAFHRAFKRWHRKTPHSFRR
jgi:AraC-like DNA-binding protein